VHHNFLLDEPYVSLHRELGTFPFRHANGTGWIY
jgi:hypothetical protein